MPPPPEPKTSVPHPKQLRRLRQWVATSMRPRAKGRSLTAVSLLHEDPAGHSGIAAASQWAKEVWRSCARDPTALSLPQLMAWWEAVLGTGRPKLCWRKAGGPIEKGALELERIS